MWIFSVTGFYSIVDAGRGYVKIRARSEADLSRLLRRFKSKVNIISTPERDYPFRINVKTATWQQWAAALAGDASGYTNFKSAIEEIDPQRVGVYHKVWSDCCEIEWN